MLDNLLDIEVAYSLLRGGNEDGDKDPIDINYEKLRTDIKVKKKKKVADQECMLMSCWSVNRSAKLKVDRCPLWRRATRMAMVLEHMLHNVLLRVLGLFNVEERRLWVYLTSVYKYQVG